MSRSTTYGLPDPDAKCSICDRKTGGAHWCVDCAPKVNAIDADAKALAATMLAIASSAPPIGTDSPTLDPTGTFRAVVSEVDMDFSGDPK